MRVDHGRAHVRVTEQLLHRANVVTGLEHMRRERVAHRVRRGWLVDPGIANRLPHRTLKRLILDVMAANDASARIA
jgi:hypothetical protein